MSSRHYRYYRLDGVGHLHSAEWIEAENDEEAVTLVEALHPDALCEIWQLHRLIARLPKRIQA